MKLNPPTENQIAHSKKKIANFLFLCGWGLLAASAGFRMDAAPVEVTSGSGSLNVSSTIEGVHYFGTATTNSVSRWNPNLNGFLWNGTDYTSGDTYGILNRTSYRQDWNIVTIKSDIIFDAGSGGLKFSGWGSNMDGNQLTLRANNSTIEFNGALSSSKNNASLIVESGVSNIIVSGPISTKGGNVDIYGNGTGSLNGTDLDGGSFTIHNDRAITFGSSSFRTGGGNLSILGNGNQIFNGPIELGGGDLIWSGNGNGTFNNNLKSQGGNMDFTGDGNFSFQLIDTGGGDFNWNGSGDADFNNNLSASGGEITFVGSGNLTFDNPVTTTTISGNITIGGNQTVDFNNNLTTNGGSISIEGNAQVTADNPITTNGGSFNVSGSAGITAGNNISTNGGDISIDSSGNVVTNGNVTTNGGTVTITGTGNTSFNAGVNTNNGDIILDGDGSTSFSSDPTLGSGKIIVKGGGTLLFDNGSNTSRFDVLLDGGTFNTAGQNRLINTLTLSANSVINMGTSSSSLIDILQFNAINNFSPYDGSSLINIDSFADAGNDQILFSNSSGITGNEAFFRFRGDFGSGEGVYFASLQNHTSGGYLLTPGLLDYSVVPVPEPSTWISAIFILIFAPMLYRMRISSKK